MKRQSVIAVSLVAILLAAGLLAGCDKASEEQSSASSTVTASKSGEVAHDMKTMNDKQNTKQHDMDMQAGEELQVPRARSRARH